MSEETKSEMSEETKNETTTPAAPKVRIEPLSVASVGPLNVMIFRKTITTGDVRSQVYASIKRAIVSPEDDVYSIPLMEIPALVMLLKSVAEPAMSVQSLVKPEAPPAPAPKAKPAKAKKR